MEPPAQEFVTSCPICGSGDLVEGLRVVDHSISQETFSLRDCSGCGFRSTSPRPPLISLPGYYDSVEYRSHNTSVTSFIQVAYHTIRWINLRSKYRLIRRHHSGGDLLDIGCGTGAFLRFGERLGFSVVGVEPSARARDAAIANSVASVYASVDELPADQRFDVITLWHALEHVPDLHALFASVRVRLRPGGVLVVAVPDRGSWDCAHYQAHWAAWDVPRHLWHFRGQDIGRLLAAHGFQGLTEVGAVFDAYYIALLSSRYAGSGFLSSTFAGLVFGAWSNLMALLGKRPYSSMIYVCRKLETQ
mgnify:CR=1 FL=1